MKNLFKNLMLVAVAAMAFTSCSQDVNELNKLEKKTTFEFVASFDGDTRSGFTGSSEDENGKVVYHSEWFGGETVMLVAGDQVKSATVDAEGKFTATFDGEISQIDIYTPMESFYKPYMDYNFYQVNPEVLAEQTPLANSVDPKAHVAKGYVLVDGEGNQIIPVTLAHEVAYGKMTVNTPAEFVIDHVEIALNGVFDGSTRNLSYTINADKVENNTFWFATQPMDVTEFTVTAYDAEGKAVTKTVDVAEAGKTMSFQCGRVGTFSVSGLDVPAEPEETYDSTYAYVYEGNVEYNDVTYMFVADDNRGLRIDFCGIIKNKTIPVGTYTFSTNYGMYPNWCYYYANVYDYYTSKLNGGQAVVSVKDGQYKIVFTDMSLNGSVYVEQFTFKGELPGLNVPDPRTKLATPEVEYDVNEMTVSLSWKAIEGVEYYSIECDSEAISNFTTTETSATITLPEYGVYDFSVTAVVSENNENYLSSDAAYVMVNVKDPNAWADYMLTSVAVSGNYVTFQDANNNRVTVIFSKQDRIGNAIKLGNYNIVYSENPASGQFVTYMVTYDGVTKYSYQIGSGYMSVEEVNGEYKILIIVDGVRFGFIGTGELGAPITYPVIIPSTEELSFVQSGGEKTINLTTANLTEDIVVSSTNNHFTAVVSGNVLTVTAPENTVEQVQEASITLSANGVTATVAVSQDAYNPNAAVEDGSEANPYSFKAANTNGWFINFDDASNGDSLQMDVNTTDMRTWIRDNGADTWIKLSKLLYDGGGNIYTHNQNTYYLSNYAGYSYMKLSRTDNGVYTCDFKMTVDGGSTYTYYRYVGTIGGQQ